MAVFGAAAGLLAVLAKSPAGEHISIFLGTFFLLTARGLVRKFGAAAVADFISGITAFAVSGGPLLLVLFPVKGLVIDTFLLLIRREVDHSKATSALSGLIPYPFNAVFMYFGFMFLGRVISPDLFLILSGLYGISGALGGLGAYYILKKIRKVG